MLLVTGITGHTGRYFLQELIDHRYEGLIRCIVRKSSDTLMLDNCELNIEKVYGDLNDEKFVCNAFEGVDSIMHIYNIHHSTMIVDAAVRNNVKRAILVHTTGIYSSFKYASQGYKEVEKTVLEKTSSQSCPTKITIVRPTMIYGDLCDSNMSKFIKMVDKFKIIPVINSGRSWIQPVNARDLGKALYTVLMTPENTSGKTYDLSGERPLQMIEVFRMISNNLGKRTIFMGVPLEIGILLAKFTKIITLKKIDYVEKVQRMGEDRSYSHIDARNDFDYKPMKFEEGIKIEVDQFLRK